MNEKAIEEGEAAVILRDELKEKIALNGGLAVDMMNWLADQYRKTYTKFHDLILPGKKGCAILEADTPFQQLWR
ncbi:hypothetical protein [Peribacillus glennii]|uniref:hypothetical protein n=1 Tax=Peribacillus glennii TaxID=2303991 RepID=UPI001F1BB206|nr:hypothetical protein [Peribacillus glennii]